MIYLTNGLDAVKNNQKDGIKGNHHVANAQKQFQLAHTIYIEYSKDVYINWFTDKELLEEYVFGMTANGYYTCFLTSNFKDAEEIYTAVSTHSCLWNQLPLFI